MLWVMVMVMCLLAVRSASQSCQRSCGNVTIPYPFGLEEDDSNCSLDENFKLLCNKTSVPHKLFRNKNRHVPVINISLEGQMTVIVWPAYDCYDENGTSTHRSTTELRLHQGYRFNYTRNKLVGIGCDTLAYISDFEKTGFQSGCTSFCWDTTSVSNGTCSGIGCCDAVIPKDVLYINVSVSSFRNHRQCWKFNQCSYAFLADKDWFNFSISDLSQFKQRVKYHIGTSIATPVVLDWAVGDLNCTETKKGERARYACGTNTMCVESNNGPGYLCHCEEGYKGNPYEQHGCQDINECDENLEHKPCMGHCHNTQGSYTCSCPAGQRGDGRTGGSGCNPAILYTTNRILVGGSFLVFLLFLVLGTSWVWCCRQQKKLRQLKMKFFKQNGGTLLQEKLSSHEHSTEAIIVFTSEELKAATNNYQENQILGQGGYGTVYKGILPDGRIVAIKKSRIVDKEQTEQFINEVVILSQINHRNVVKLLGCCLETENPLLVYEFIINGTLFHHIHDKDRKYSISWNNRLRIAAETAGALAYLHSSASQPIIHRDVKSANILLDENYTAKVADFGASRLIALDQTHLSTLVQGTRGYLDPEYLQTSLLTDKSDVYSFGVVLVELLTGRKAFCYDEPEDERNLAMFFVSAMKANHLFEVLEHRVVSEGRSEEIQDVANLAKRCLRVNNEERPTMKEVAIELEGIKISATHVWTDQKPEESVYLLGEPANSYDGNTQNDSIRTRAINSLHTGR